MKRLCLGFLICLTAPAIWAGDGPKKGGPFEVEVVRGIVYREGKDADPVRNQLDIYLPKGQKNFPVLMFVHGGYWKTGSKDLYGASARFSPRTASARSSSTTASAPR